MVSNIIVMWYRQHLHSIDRPLNFSRQAIYATCRNVWTQNILFTSLQVLINQDGAARNTSVKKRTTGVLTNPIVSNLRESMKKLGKSEEFTWAEVLDFTPITWIFNINCSTETLLRLLFPLSAKVCLIFSFDTIKKTHLNTQSVKATGGVYILQGRNQH